MFYLVIQQSYELTLGVSAVAAGQALEQGIARLHIIGRRNEAANCIELAEFAGSARLAELAELAARLAELAGFAGAGGCVEVAEFAGVGSGRLTELVEFVTRFAGAAGYVEQAEFAGTGAVRFAELADKPRPIMLKISPIMLLSSAQNVPIMLNIMPISTAIMPQFIYNFIILKTTL